MRVVRGLFALTEFTVLGWRRCCAEKMCGMGGIVMNGSRKLAKTAKRHLGAKHGRWQALLATAEILFPSQTMRLPAFLANKLPLVILPLIG